MASNSDAASAIELFRQLLYAANGDVNQAERIAQLLAQLSNNQSASQPGQITASTHTSVSADGRSAASAAASSAGVAVCITILSERSLLITSGIQGKLRCTILCCNGNVYRAFALGRWIE